MLKITPAYSFDDVLLVPRWSPVPTRGAIDLSVDLGKHLQLKIPIIAANMKHVAEVQMADALGSLGGLTILHRFCSIEEQLAMYQACQYPQYVGAAIGVKSEDRERADKLIEAGCLTICVDVAHGDSLLASRMVEWLREEWNELLIIAGNVATASGALTLAQAGADVVKCNIGSGSICSTRIEAGTGVPSITALSNVFTQACQGIHNQYNTCYKKSSERGFKIIADGGITTAGNLGKALCFSDAVMLGSLLAGTPEAPGEIFEKDGQQYKRYDGSSTFKHKNVEGIKAMVKVKPPVAEVIERLMDGLRSCCSYQGVYDLEDLKRNPEFVQISQAGLRESHPHSVLELS